MDSNTIQIQALITFITPMLIQLAKRSQNAALGWIDQHRPKVCVFTSAVAALATSMGVEVARAPHSVTVSWPDAATMAHGLAAFLVSAVLQFAAQHALYEGFWRHVVPAGGGVRETENGIRDKGDKIPETRHRNRETEHPAAGPGASSAAERSVRISRGM